MSVEQARAVFGFDAIEEMLMGAPLARVLDRLAADDDRATVPPPRPVTSSPPPR